MTAADSPSVAVLVTPDAGVCDVHSGRQVHGGRWQLPVGSYRVGRASSADIVIGLPHVPLEQAVLDVHSGYAVIRRAVQDWSNDGHGLWTRSGGGVATKLPAGQWKSVFPGERLSVHVLPRTAVPGTPSREVRPAVGASAFDITVAPVCVSADLGGTPVLADPVREDPGYVLVVLAALPLLTGRGEVALRSSQVAALWRAWSGRARAVRTVENIISGFRCNVGLAPAVERLSLGEVVTACVARGMITLADAEYLLGGPAALLDLLQLLDEGHSDQDGGAAR